MSDDYLKETDRKYIKFKMKQLKRAKQNGNEPKARRIAVELNQYIEGRGIVQPEPFVDE